MKARSRMVRILTEEQQKRLHDLIWQSEPFSMDIDRVEAQDIFDSLPEAEVVVQDMCCNDCTTICNTLKHGKWEGPFPINCPLHTKPRLIMLKGK
jgi:hypothetical protein